MTPNPWHALPATAPYLLPLDADIIKRHNAKEQRTEFRIHDELLPEPYLGRANAPVMLLGSNPSFSTEDEPFYKDLYIQQQWQKNILHEPMEYPFYLINPRLKGKGGGYEWWSQKLGHLIKATRLDKVANNLCCVEYFPYHTSGYTYELQVPSQQYNLYLVRQAIERESLIIMMSRKTWWIEAIPELQHYPYLTQLKSYRNPTITNVNLPNDFLPLVRRIMKG